MSTGFTPPEAPRVGPTPAKLGCLGKGCIFVAIVMLIFAGALGFGAYSMYRQLYDMTSAEPAAVPVHAASQTQAQEVGRRYRAFVDLVQQGRAGNIRLTAQDMNTLIAVDPALEGVKGKVYFCIQDNLMRIQTSVPMGDTPFVKGRYLNANIALKLFIESGQVTIEPTAVEANGKKMPPQFLKALQGLRWSETLRKEPEIARILDQIKTLKIEDNALVVETQ
jgi:hypothetical protein